MKKFSLENNYKIKSNFDTSKNVINSLSLYYLPLIGIEAFSFYCFLLAENENKKNDKQFFSSSRIKDYLFLSEEKINSKLINLEKYGLLEIYYNIEDEKNITYYLKEPLDYNKILNTKQFIFFLENKIGKENYKLTIKNLENNLLNTNKDILIKTELLIENYNEIKNNSFSIDLKNLFSLLKKYKINYNEFWNSKIEETIKNFIILNKIKLIDIARTLKYIIDNNLKINEKNIIKIFYTLNNDIKSRDIFSNKIEILKSMNPYDFLSMSLERKSTIKENEVIEKLTKKYCFNKSNINLLLDYSLIINEGKIVPKYIYKISNSLVEQGILSFDELSIHLKNSYKAKKLLLKNNNEIKKNDNKNYETENIKKNKFKNKMLKNEEFYDDDFWGDL